MFVVRRNYLLNCSENGLKLHIEYIQKTAPGMESQSFNPRLQLRSSPLRFYFK